MSSGLYSALSGAVTENKNLNIITNNLANINTFGFKKERLHFNSLLTGAIQKGPGKGINFRTVGESVTDFSQGQLEKTGRSLDLAIKGNGFFKVAGKDGFYYTRHGSFKLLSDGSLVTQNGRQVVGENGPVNIPNSQVRIDEQGRIWDGDMQVGLISVYSVDDMKALDKYGDTCWVAKGDVKESIVNNKAKVVQGAVEQSNTNAIEAIWELINCKREFGAYQRAIKTYGRLADKANQIGRLG